METLAADYGEIAALELVRESEDAEEAMLRVRTVDERAFLLFLPPAPNEAAQFVRAIAFRAGMEPVEVIEPLPSVDQEDEGEAGIVASS